MLILGPNCSESDLGNIAVNYAYQLKSLGANTISIVLRGKRDLAFLIKTAKYGYYIEMCFLLSPKALLEYETKLKLDKNVLRYLALNNRNESF